MGTNLNDKLERSFNSELARRLLVRYFHEKGFTENFDTRVHPPMLQDLNIQLPEFYGKLEVTPHALEIDPQTGWAKIGWNLFVLGNQRMYLGETEHADMKNLAKFLDEGSEIIVDTSEDQPSSRYERTARDIINFITRVLEGSQSGILRQSTAATPRPTGASSMGQNMFEKPRTARPEQSGDMRM